MEETERAEVAREVEALVFTGIIEATGRVQSMTRLGTSAHLEVEPEGFAADALELGESVAFDGCCLTVVSKSARAFAVDVSHETLARTTLGALRPGERLNLERALRVGDRLGGHFVLGHVDGVGQIAKVVQRGEAWDVTFRAPPEVARFLLEKGSVAIDGVSLTVNRCGGDDFDVTLIRYTREKTALAKKGVGAKVNLEADILGKYVQRFLSGGRASGGAGLEFL